jgi:copper resistance protein B
VRRTAHRLPCWLALLAVASAAAAQGVSEQEHVPPDPPQYRMHTMPYHDMAEMMGMDDRSRTGMVMLDRVEWQENSDNSQVFWDAAAWYGGDFDKLRAESEGERDSDRTLEARHELLWDRIVSAWWSLRAGVGHDGGLGPARAWAAIGFAGLAPGWFELSARLYVGDAGRTALRMTAERDFMFTQRLVLQPEFEAEAFGKEDSEKLNGSGLASLKLGLRLRYELRREFAPYVGVRWVGHFGDTQDLRRAAGEDSDELLWLAGVRAWF